MRVVLIGADLEENLGLCMLTAVAESAGHQVQVLPFNEPLQRESLCDCVVRAQPDLVGLSIQFQHRAGEFLSLARALRRRGYAGHLTCGGQVPSMAWREMLAGSWGLSSVVLYEGEETLVQLLAALAAGDGLEQVPGLALPGADGEPLRTAERPLVADLDRLPFARRYRSHTRHMGLPFIPIMGGRGCWGQCSFCSITTVHRDARRMAGGKSLRFRSPDNIADEMALLSHAVGGPAVFCFHDDTFLLPRPEDSLTRVRAIRQALDQRGVGPVGIIGKCRPDCLTPELALELRRLGVVRLYVGVENVSPAGSRHLNRRVEVEQVHRAMAASHAAGIFSCYNLLLFEPDASLADVEHNVAFMRQHASHPVNFCRAEPYSGTPLMRLLQQRGELAGNYLGHDYRIADPQVELLFRVCAAAFRERNFAPDGVHNRYMGLGYYVTLLDMFYDDPPAVAALAREADGLTRRIVLESADFLDEALELVRSWSGDRDRVERETADLGLRIAAADRAQHARLDQLLASLNHHANTTALAVTAPPAAERASLAQRIARSAAVGMWIVGWALGTQGCDDRNVVVDPVPPDGGKDTLVVDPPPRDMGPDMGGIDPAPKDMGPDNMVVDPAPLDMGPDVPLVDPPPMDMGPDVPLVDPLPPDGMIVDPPPPDMGTDHWMVDPAPVDGSAALESEQATERLVAGHFRDTAPRRAERSRDLPLFGPPSVALSAERQGAQLVVRLEGGAEQLSLRWQADGEIEGTEREVRWRPASATDRISVGVRTAGGIAVVSLKNDELV